MALSFRVRRDDLQKLTVGDAQGVGFVRVQMYLQLVGGAYAAYDLLQNTGTGAIHTQGHAVTVLQPVGGSLLVGHMQVPGGDYHAAFNLQLPLGTGENTARRTVYISGKAYYGLYAHLSGIRNRKLYLGLASYGRLGDGNRGRIFFCDHEEGDKPECEWRDLKAFFADCHSERIDKNAIKSIEERESFMVLSGRGDYVTEGLRRTWQEEIDWYKEIRQQEVILDWPD